LRYCNSA